MPRVLVPPPCRGPTAGAAELRVEGATILECLEAVESGHPGFLAQVLAPGGRVHHYVRIFLNGRQVAADGLDQTVGDRDEIQILAAIAGG